MVAETSKKPSYFSVAPGKPLEERSLGAKPITTAKTESPRLIEKTPRGNELVDLISNLSLKLLAEKYPELMAKYSHRVPSKALFNPISDVKNYFAQEPFELIYAKTVYNSGLAEMPFYWNPDVDRTMHVADGFFQSFSRDDEITRGATALLFGKLLIIRTLEALPASIALTTANSRETWRNMTKRHIREEIEDEIPTSEIESLPILNAGSEISFRGAEVISSLKGRPPTAYHTGKKFNDGIVQILARPVIEKFSMLMHELQIGAGLTLSVDTNVEAYAQKMLKIMDINCSESEEDYPSNVNLNLLFKAYASSTLPKYILDAKVQRFEDNHPMKGKAPVETVIKKAIEDFLNEDKLREIGPCAYPL